MKTLFVEAKAKVNVNNLVDKIKLPKRVGLVSSVQFLENLKGLRSYLAKRGIKVLITGQVLGCNVTNPTKFKSNVDAYLFIGSGGFHPVELARVTKKPVFILNPITNVCSKITKEEVETIEKRKKGMVLSYLRAKKVGVLVTIKPGQENMNLAYLIKDKIKNKEIFIFVGNEITENDLINFPGVDAWVNTACSRIEINKVVNFEEIAKYLKPIPVTKMG